MEVAGGIDGIIEYRPYLVVQYLMASSIMLFCSLISSFAMLVVVRVSRSARSQLSI